MECQLEHGQPFRLHGDLVSIRRSTSDNASEDSTSLQEMSPDGVLKCQVFVKRIAEDEGASAEIVAFDGEVLLSGFHFYPGVLAAVGFGIVPDFYA